MDSGVIILIVVGVVIFSLITLGIFLAVRKRTIKIILDNYNFAPGDKVTGKLLIKKDFLEVNEINVGISCYLNERSSSAALNRGSVSKTNERSKNTLVFEFKKPLKVGGGIKKDSEHPFELTIPKDVMTKIDNNIAKVAVAVVSALTGNFRRYDWYVEARIDKKGLDIKNKQKIMIS